MENCPKTHAEIRSLVKSASRIQVRHVIEQEAKEMLESYALDFADWLEHQSEVDKLLASRIRACRLHFMGLTDEEIRMRSDGASDVREEIEELEAVIRDQKLNKEKSTWVSVEMTTSH